MNTLDTLMQGAIDYAGLFPPAALPLGDAVDALLSYRTHQQGTWLSGRFAVGVKTLPALVHQIQRRMPLDAFPIALIVPEGRLGSVLAAAADGIEGTPIRVEAVELGLTDEMSAKEATLFTRSVFADARIFIEIPFTDAGTELLQSLPAVPGGVCAKFRTGGLTPEQIPSSRAIAERLVTAASLRLPWKATAGLHEPFPHFDAAVGARLHGFLNLFVAACACFGGERSIPAVAALLDGLSPTDLVFSPESLVARGMHISRANLMEMRQAFALGFGSCSFIDPVEQMQRHYPELF